MRLIGGWCGMRGAVSLAAALALAEDFPQRDIVLFLTFAVIFATLVLQGLTLPALIKLLGVEDDGADEREELIGRRAAVDAALARLDELGEAEWTRDDTDRADAADVRVPSAPVRDPRRRGRRRRTTTRSRPARTGTRRWSGRC